LAQQWNESQNQVTLFLQQEAADLRRDLDQAARLISSLRTQPMSAPQQIPNVESIFQRLETKVSAAESRLQGMYSELEREINETNNQLTQVNWCLDQKDQASFPFLAGEALFLASEAEWEASKEDKPDGVLYITDQRLLFEQKEKVGKKLGMFGGKQVQQLKWEVPLNLVQDIQTEDKGFLGSKDILNFTLGSGAPYPKITVEVKSSGDSKFWASQIKRMISGEAASERAIQPDPQLLSALKAAPTQCPNCGGMMPQIVAGQMEAHCKYCGYVVRI
jgi:hypothetical protein